MKNVKSVKGINCVTHSEYKSPSKVFIEVSYVKEGELEITVTRENEGSVFKAPPFKIYLGDTVKLNHVFDITKTSTLTY